MRMKHLNKQIYYLLYTKMNPNGTVKYRSSIYARYSNIR